MPLMDALRSGVDLVNASNQGVVDAAKARYAYPQTQADLEKTQLGNTYQGLVNKYYGPAQQAAIDYQNIINTYQPTKSQQENDYQALVNKYYAPNIESEINAKNAETRFTPLKYAIQADNSQRNSSRFGGSYQYLKAVSDMPADQKTVWMADPGNYQQYQNEIQNLHNSMSNQQGVGGITSAVTPALLKSVGLGPIANDILSSAPPKAPVNQPAPGGLSAPIGGASAQAAPPVVINMPGQGAPPQMPPQAQGGMAAPISLPAMGNGQAPMMQQPNYTPVGAPPMASPIPQGAPPIPQGAPTQRPVTPPAFAPNTPPLTPQAASVSQKDGIAPADANHLASVIKNPELSPQERQLLSFQLIANKKSIPAQLNNQANAAVVYEKLLSENQDRFGPAFKNAASYAGALGRGKQFAEQFQAQHPQSYQDYTWVTNDLIPALGQNIRRIEGLASTDGQRNALNAMFTSVLKWNSDPDMAVNNINKTIGLFEKQARAVLEAAQPAYPGVLEKIHGINFNDQKPYVKGDIKKLSDAEIMQRLGRQ